MNDEVEERAPADEAEHVAIETMAGDLTTWLLDRLKHLPKSWAELPAYEQAAIIDSATVAVKHQIARVVRTLAAEGRATINATLTKVVIKDGIQAVLELSKSDPHRHELADSQGSDVLIIVADADPYLGGEVPKPEDDQGRLIPDNDEQPLFDRTPVGEAA